MPLDWAQAFARKQATLVAGTGYQYGDTDFIEYSERLYLNFAKQLRAKLPDGTSGPVPVGEALVKAKLQYLATTPDIRGIHQKALLEATLFGLPMLGVNMPSGRTTINPIAPAVTPNPVAAGTGGVPLGLMMKDVAVPPTLTPHDVTLNTVQKSATTYAATTCRDRMASRPIRSSPCCRCTQSMSRQIHPVSCCAGSASAAAITSTARRSCPSPARQ